jgi:hypothetical protein
MNKLGIWGVNINSFPLFFHLNYKQIMKRLIIMLFIGITAFTNKEIPVEIYWSDNFTMTRDHFTQVESMDAGRAASIATEIRLNMNYNGTFTARAFAIFNTKQSYMLKRLDNWQLGIVLAHEQVHFNITEYNVRMLNNSLSGVKDQATMLAQYNYWVNKKDRMQEQYDNETKHGLDDAEQARWNKKLKELLNIK